MTYTEPGNKKTECDGPKSAGGIGLFQVFACPMGKLAVCDDEGSEMTKNLMKHLKGNKNLQFPEIFNTWQWKY